MASSSFRRKSRAMGPKTERLKGTRNRVSQSRKLGQTGRLRQTLNRIVRVVEETSDFVHAIIQRICLKPTDEGRGGNRHRVSSESRFIGCASTTTHLPLFGVPTGFMASCRQRTTKSACLESIKALSTCAASSSKFLLSILQHGFKTKETCSIHKAGHVPSGTLQYSRITACLRFSFETLKRTQKSPAQKKRSIKSWHHCEGFFFQRTPSWGLTFAKKAKNFLPNTWQRQSVWAIRAHRCIQRKSPGYAHASKLAKKRFTISKLIRCFLLFGMALLICNSLQAIFMFMNNLRHCVCWFHAICFSFVFVCSGCQKSQSSKQTCYSHL